MGEIVYDEVETVDETLSQGEIFGTIEAVKTLTDLQIPVDGVVIEFNEKLADNPDIINSDLTGKAGS